jgi:putative membrane protein
MRFGAIISAAVAAGVALAANGGVAFAQDGDHMGDWGGGWWIAMVFMMVIFWAAVIALVVWGVRSVAGPRHDSRTPLDIARERLAKGEISEEEFERIKRQLI